MAPRKKKLNPEQEKVADKVGASALAVYSATGQYIRTYSLGEHGTRFKELAEMFAYGSKNKAKGYVVKKAG